MKKKFIFLAMMLLTLLGGVNNLGAQEVVVHEDATSKSSIFPIPTYYGQAFAQTLYKASDFGDVGPSTITSIAFKKDNDSFSRNFSVYMLNTDADSFSGFFEFSETEDKVYSNTSLSTASEDGWMTLILDEPFEYEGGNLVIITWDRTKSTTYGEGCKYIDIGTTTALYSTNSMLTYDNYLTYTYSSTSRQPAIRINFEASGPKPLSLTVTADEENIWNDETATLTAKAKGGAAPYTYSWTLNNVAIEDAIADTYTFSNETAGTYSFTCTVTDSESATATASVTVNVAERPINPFAGKQYRIKVVEGSYAGQYLKVLSHDQPINPTYYTSDAATRVGVSEFEQNPLQIFTITDDGEGHYYLCDADGYYIKCDDQSSYNGRNTWDIDAYSTTIKTPLMFDYVNETNFYIRDYDKYVGNGSTANHSTTNNYFKVQDGLVYCDATIDKYESDSHRTVLWTVEEVLPVAPNAPVLTAEALGATSIRLSWNAVYGAASYTVYEGENVIAENITDTYYEVSGLTANTTYTYTVTATNEVGTSEKSNEASATTWAPAPETAPANLTATNVTHNSVTLSWDAVDGATYYEVYKNAAYYNYTNDITYNVTGLDAETEYTFTVKAGNNSGISPESEALVVTTEKFEGRTIIFELNDYYGWGNYDGWNGNYLLVQFSDGTPTQITHDGTAATVYSYIDVPYGTTVTVTYINTGSYQSENTYYIRYYDNQELIHQDGRAITGNAPKANEPFTFTVERPAPKNLVANPSAIYPDQTTTISWEAYEGAETYNIYVNDELVDNTAELSYELSELPYENEIAVVAVDAEGTEISGKARISVKVAGTFTLTVNVKDAEGNAIEGAIVTIDMTSAYDELLNQVQAVEALSTDVNGNASITLPILTNSTYFYANNGNYVYTSYYGIKASKSPYTESIEQYIYYSDDVNVTKEFTLELPTVAGLRFTDEGSEVGPAVMENTTIELVWEVLEGADAYKVYKYNSTTYNYDLLAEVIETSYEIYTEYEEGYIYYAVSAVFANAESDMSYTFIKVYGDGSFYGTVTDAAGNPLEGVKYVLSGTNAISGTEGGDIVDEYTDAEGKFSGSALMDGEYTLTISHCNYETFEMPVEIEYHGNYDCGIIQLTAKPLAEGITSVTATDNGDYANVTWEVDETSAYTKYNVYRRDVEDQQTIDTIATEVAASPVTDLTWKDLNGGEYQYGVSTYVEGGITRSEEYQINEGFDVNEWPTGWNFDQSICTFYFESRRNSQVLYINYAPNGVYYAAVTPQVVTKDATLSFAYKCEPYSGMLDNLVVYWATSQNGPWVEGQVLYNHNNASNASWIEVENIDLSVTGEDNIYIAFCMESIYANGIFIDDVKVTVPASSEIETAIVWSNTLTKQGPITFVGTADTDWNNAANWSTGEVPAAGADVVIAAPAVISTEVNLANVNITAGSLTVANGGKLTVTGEIAQASNYLLVLEEGGQIFQNNDNVTAIFKMNIDNPTDWSNTANKDGWQFISMPMTGVPYSDFTSYGNYDLYKYDGSQDLEWQNHKDGGFYFGTDVETTFKSGTGYLASLENTETVNLYGTLNVATPFAFGPYNQIIFDEDKDLNNFKLYGNPFTHDIYMSDFDLDYDNDEVSDFADGYAVINKYGSYDYRTAADPIKVGEGFFVKALKGSQFLYQAGRRGTKETSCNSLNIIATGNAGEDNVIINLAGESEGFPKLQNFNDAVATVYVQDKDVNYGIYNCNEDVQEVALNFNANQMGNYTISIQANGKFQTVTLVDRFTGVETNMLLEDYTFTAMSGANNNRFIVRIVNGQQSTDNSHFVFQSGEDLIIEAEGTVQIVDVMGRVVYSNDVESTNNRINVSNYNDGAYVVRVINETEVKVQKVVIY